MNYKKRLLSVVLSAALTAACAPSVLAAEKSFTDVPADSACSEAVSYMTENSLISGTDETTFGADAPVSRAEAIMVLYRMAGSADTEFKGVFSDVAEDAAYAKAVEWASANGIVSGYGDTTFAPDEEITKQDLISFLYRYAVYDDAYVTVDESADLKAFSDADKAADYASDALIWAADSGIVASEDGKLNPDKTVTRSELAVIDYNYIKSLPTVQSVSVASTTRKDAQIPAYVTLPSDYSAEKTYPMVILCHGHGGNHNEWGGFDVITNGLADKGIISVTLDYPGCDASKESFQLNTMTNMKADTLDVINYMLSTYKVDKTKVGIFGYSMGGRITLELLSNKAFDFAAVELVAPAEDVTDLKNLFGGPEAWEKMKAEANEKGYTVYTTIYGQVQELSKEWFADLEAVPDGLAEAAAANYKGNSLVIYAVNDEAVSPEVSKTTAEILGSEVAVTPADGHSYSFYGTNPETISITNDGSVNFFANELLK